MQVDLTVEQEAFIQQAIAIGRYRTAEDAVQDAMARWEESERRHLKLVAALDDAESDLAAGRYSDYTNETLPDLAVELKNEARQLQGSKRY
jgi:putative addiction module CopG family antidote